MQFLPGQLQAIGRRSFRRRVRDLIERDAGAPVVADAAFARTIDRLIERAGTCGLVTEPQVAAYCLVAWRLGVDFDQRFPGAAAILDSDGLTSDGRAHGLLAWSEELLATLRADPAQDRTA